MNPYLRLLLAFILLLLPTTAHAEEPPVSPAPTAESLALRLELESVNAQHETAMVIHVVSTVIGIGGVGSLLGAFGTAFSPSSSDVVWAPTILVIVGGSLSIVNFILTCIGAGLDFGSASHRRKLLEAHPELAIEVTPGPGDAGVGLSLSF